MSQRSLQEQREQRLRNQASLSEQGFEPFPYGYSATTSAAGLQADHADAAAGDAWPDEVVTVAGRVMTLRGMGKVTFATLRDASGDLQVFLQRDRLGEAYVGVKKLDLGDWLEVTGHPFVTQDGRAHRRRARLAAAREVAPTPAGQAPRPHRQGAALPPADRSTSW
jgi:lysyl-tRNA synthetase, class II